MPSPPRLSCAVLALAACGAGAPALAPPLSSSASPLPPGAPPRYVALAPTWIERAADGADRVLVNGRRMELRGMEMVRLGPPEPEFDGGARVPSWAPAGAAPYRFWRGGEVYAADTFDGELRRVGALPAQPRGTFDWLGGVGLVLPGGALVAPSGGGAPARLGAPPFVHAVAADARRALVITALGHARLTLDGGVSYRDVGAELGGAVALEVRGDDITAVLPDGREARVDAGGAITAARAGLGHSSARGRRPADEPDRFPTVPTSRALDAALRAGVPLPDGGAVLAEDGFVARLDLATLRATSVAALDPALAGADCSPLRTADALLLACADHERASVVDVGGAPRTERTFDLAGAPDLDRFVGVDGEALGYLGPCDGPAPPRDELDVFSGGEPYNASRKRTPVFCARAGRDAWIEHRLDPADATDVIAWIPRAGGGAVALVARWGPLLDDRERVTVRGPLRVVRVARSEPPFAISPYGWEPATVLDRALRIGPDDAIEGWLTATGNGVGVLAVSIDARGHASALPGPPRAAAITSAGPFALAQADDGKLWETTDGGHRWIAVAPPPGARLGAPVTECSLAGCRLGPYARLGWSPPGGASATPDAVTSIAPSIATSPPPRHAPPRAVVRLSCAFDGAPEGQRVEGSAGFGYTRVAQPRGGVPVKIGQLGVAVMPPSGAFLPSLGDVEIGWVPPLDTSAVVRRATVSLARLALVPGGPRAHEARLGWLLTPGGGLATFPVGPPGPCLSGLLELAGISRPLGGCVDDPSVGVDLGGRVILLHAGRDALVISAVEVSARLPGPGARVGPALPVATRELGVTAVGGALAAFTFGVGARAGAPVMVVLDRSGEASLAAIDPERGTLGAEERLQTLSRAALGSDPACAPRADEATVVLPFEDLIGLGRKALRGIASTGGPGVAVLRWSRERACLDAVELPVRDERFDESQGSYEPQGVLRKIIARFDGHGGHGGKRGATLLLVANGSEVRQRLLCSALVPGDLEP